MDKQILTRERCVVLRRIYHSLGDAARAAGVSTTSLSRALRRFKIDRWQDAKKKQPTKGD